jgi:ABC-type lipoprotein export system ATPase subunit
MTFQHVIHVTDVVKTYPLGNNGFTAIDHLSLEIGQGAFVAIVGRSGSGKTTLLNLLAGIDRPTSGTLWSRMPIFVCSRSRQWRRGEVATSASCSSSSNCCRR